jgi:hypothetical protein
MADSIQSLFRDVTFANRLSSRLRNFKSKGNNVFNFSCPICGDSEKNSRKARGYVFPGSKHHSNSLFFKCYNCNASMTLEKFIARVDASLSSEYRMGRFIDASSDRLSVSETSDSEIPETTPAKILISNTDFGRFFEKIENLPKNHFAYQYLIQRDIPRDIIKSELYYAADFRQALEGVSKEYGLPISENTISKMRSNDARIIIPFTDFSGKITGFQARALDPKNPVRYITIKIDPYAPKVFGLNRLDTTKETIYVFEGPFDSLFISNAIAVMDADLSNVAALLPDIDKSKFVLVWDNEPRNPAIVSNMSKAIGFRFRIVIFSPNPGEEYEKNKDVNDIVSKEKIPPSEVQSTLDRLTYSTRSAGEAMTAELHFNKWKKINTNNSSNM